MDNNQLTFDEHNANKGTERGKELLEQSVTELGAGRSILSDKNGQIIAGNKTLAAAKKAGLKVRIVPSRRDELVVVQREDLDLSDPAGEARRLAYLDNRVSEIDLAWDANVIAEDTAAGLDMDALGFLEEQAGSNEASVKPTHRPGLASCAMVRKTPGAPEDSICSKAARTGRVMTD